MYSREIDNEILTLSASGWTYQNTFVLFDYETESIWYHLSGKDGLTCISGNYADRVLEEFPYHGKGYADQVQILPGR